MNQGPRDGDALHLAAGELRGQARRSSCPCQSRPGPRWPGGPPASLLQPAITSGIAAFSAAVSAGSRLYCWKTKPMFRRRNRVLLPVAHRGDVAAEDGHLALVGVEDAGDHRQQRGLAAARRARRSATSARRRCPDRCRRSAWTRWSPVPKCLVSPRIRTAISRGPPRSVPWDSSLMP